MYGGQWHIPDLDKLIESGLPARFPTESAQDTKTKAYVAMNAASVVFAHSILDDVLFSCCKAGWLTHRDRWSVLVRDRQLKVERLLEEPLQALIDQQLEQRVRSEPMPRKAKILLDRYGSALPGVSATIRAYSFDQKRLHEFTELRNRIVHDGVFPKTDLTDDLDFIYKTGNALMQTTAVSCGSPLDFLECLKAAGAMKA
jgi:hypothetical protein